MRALLTGSIAAAAMIFALAGAPALAGPDPTVGQIYEAASSGRMDEAQRMMDQVLRDHPGSAKAHFVQAELFARQGKLALARSEFDQAQQLKPGLPDESPRAVQQLAAQLAAHGAAAEPAGVHHFPWGAALILALVIAAFWMLFRRRPSYAYPANPASPGAFGPGAYGPGAYPAQGGGIGSSIAGGLAGGLAAGAGIVAGEELAHHFLDGDRTAGGAIAPANAGEWESGNPKGDMGGANFGVKDPSSWDDGAGSDFGGGGDSGGGGDWT